MTSEKGAPGGKDPRPSSPGQSQVVPFHDALCKLPSSLLTAQTLPQAVGEVLIVAVPV